MKHHVGREKRGQKIPGRKDAETMVMRSITSLQDPISPRFSASLHTLCEFSLRPSRVIPPAAEPFKAAGDDKQAAMGRLRAVAVSATSGVGFLTILAAFVLARVNGVYCGGLLWPFLSDLGRGASRRQPWRSSITSMQLTRDAVLC